MTTPKFIHDCDLCYFVGQTIYGGAIYDLYLHSPESPEAEFSTTLLARYGSGAGEYLSGSEFALIHLERGEVDHPLVRALVKCRQLGFVEHGTLKLKVRDHVYGKLTCQPHIKRTPEEIAELQDQWSGEGEV